MHPLAEKISGLYAIVDTASCDENQLFEKVSLVLNAGCRVLQYRDKTSDNKKRLLQAGELRLLCDKAGAVLIINDDAELAMQVKADGVHCGRDDAGIKETRARYPTLIIGASCYNSIERAEQAIKSGADYVAFGCFYPSSTKPEATPADIETLQQAKQRFVHPIVAIGGIVAENAGILISSGASTVAVNSGIFSVADPYLSSKEICALFNNPQQTVETKSDNTKMNNEELFQQASIHIPGGVNSPVRAFKSVGGAPVFFKRGSGARLWDEQGREYIDYVASWGPMILGHSHPAVINAVKKQIEAGLGYGAPTVLETRMADLVCELVPSMDKVRMVSSGTEATMSAIRLARGATGRDKLIKFEGCYHGHSDSLLVKAGSGALTLGVPTSPGVPAGLAKLTLTLEYNNLQQVAEVMAAEGEEIACIIVEPVAGNMNCVPPVAGFLEGLRKLCDEYGTVLIFDEVMTGFRVSLGGAQAYYSVAPDLTTLGKVIGGGLPVGAFGGKADLMDQIAPDGPVYQAGTLSGNPVAMSAGLAMLENIQAEGFYDQLSATALQLVSGIQQRAKAADIALTFNQVGGMFGLFFTDNEEVTRFADVMGCDVERFNKFFHGMLEQGINLAPSSFEAGFVSSAHGQEEINLTLDAAEKVFASIK